MFDRMRGAIADVRNSDLGAARVSIASEDVALIISISIIVACGSPQQAHRARYFLIADPAVALTSCASDSPG